MMAGHDDAMDSARIILAAVAAHGELVGAETWNEW